MKYNLFLILIVLTLLLGACTPLQTSTPTLFVTVSHDGITDQISVPENFTVRQAISALSLTLGALDRIEPGLETKIASGMAIKVIRVIESFVVEEKTLPFESQTIKNESLPVGQTILIQAGTNGIQSLTYRVLSEDGVEVSRAVTKIETTQPAAPEIIMLGVQSTYKSIPINGLLAYTSSSNAWVMEANSGNRRSLVSTGDLDGRIFSISPDKKWLLFSRSADKKEKDTINSLWVVNITQIKAEPISLGIKNVVHFADWVPAKTNTVAFSTVEPRSTAPGWQANNDLKVIQFGAEGNVVDSKTLVGANSGGIYGWWGTNFLWSPDASEIAYARPDSVGLVDSKTGQFNPLIEFAPYQTSGDWAWVPPLAWASNHSLLYTVIPSNQSSNSTQFNLNAFLIDQLLPVSLQPKTGLFAYPSVSSVDENSKYQIAFLSAILPDQSETSRYDLRVMDRDGSNMKKLYPGEGISGLDPQHVVWSPKKSDNVDLLIAFIAQGNLIFVNPSTGALNQITGDGSISRIDWK